MLILFDIDMTLLESKHIGISCLKQAGEELFSPDFTIESIVFGGGLDPNIISDMLKLNQIEPTSEHIQSMRSTYHQLLREKANEQKVANALPGAHNLVNATREHHTKPTLGLLTGNYEETGIIKVQSAGFDPSNFIVNAWGDSSPHPNPIRSHLPPVAIQRYNELKGANLDPQQVVIIGDTIHDVRCAKDSGCRSLAVATGHHDRDTLTNEGADLVVDHLRDTEGLIEWIMTTL